MGESLLKVIGHMLMVSQPDTILPYPLTAVWTQRIGMAHPTLPTFYMGPNCWWAEHRAHMSHEEP